MSKIFNYLNYFFYIALNWNPRLAVFVIYHEIKGERKYGIDTSGFDKLKKLQNAGRDISHATLYMPVSYYVMEKVLTHVDVSSKTHFADLGCGKGRSLCMAAVYGCKKLTGIEFSPELCFHAGKNLESVKKKIPSMRYAIVNADAAYYSIPDDTDCLFLFNPFDEKILKPVIKNIHESLRRKQRIITIIYVNPVNKKLFTESGFSETYSFKRMKYLEFSILSSGKSNTD